MSSRFSFFGPKKDTLYLMQAHEAAKRSLADGNHPFGAVLVSQDGEVLLSSGNVEVTERDCTGHAETNLMRLASKRFSPSFLWDCSLYTTVEPCAMCSGAMYWGNLGRLVYGVEERKLLALTGDNPLNPTFDLPCREVFARGQKNIVVVGPTSDSKLEAELLSLHREYWKRD
ncbi:MAG: nucleoside deaminase [Fretibacterium sp.]|nr:nucleoside deaminase [Fretibacterium sp.]